MTCGHTSFRPVPALFWLVLSWLAAAAAIA